MACKCQALAGIPTGRTRTCLARPNRIVTGCLPQASRNATLIECRRGGGNSGGRRDSRGRRATQNNRRGTKSRWQDDKVGRGYSRPRRDPMRRAWMDEEIELEPWPENKPTPKLVVFDLDDTIWFPELYMIRGAPFRKDNDGRLFDRSDEEIRTYPAARAALRAIESDPALEHTKVAYASRTNKREWAITCMQQLKIGGKNAKSLQDVCDFLEIHGGTKKKHFASISRDSGIAYKDMLFFDNEEWNCMEVSQLGVTSIYCPRGMDVPSWNKGMQEFVQVKAPVYPR